MNVPKRMERKEVRIAGDDVSRLAAHSEFQEFVILGITARCYLDVHSDPLSLAGQSRDESADILFVNILTKLFSTKNFVEFGEHGIGNQYFPFSEREVKSEAGLRIGQKQCADQDVRIEYEAQLRALQE